MKLIKARTCEGCKALRIGGFGEQVCYLKYELVDKMCIIYSSNYEREKIIIKDGPLLGACPKPKTYKALLEIKKNGTPKGIKERI